MISSAVFPPADSLSTQTPAQSALLRPAASREDWAAVRAMRFAALSRSGDIPARALPVYGDAYDAAPGAVTYLLEAAGRVVGSTRCMHSRAGGGIALPAVEAFGSELDPGIAAASVVEASLTLVEGPVDRARVLLSLFKVHMTACAAFEAEWLLAAVRETEMGFHRRVFGMDILTGSARWPGLALPRVLMGLPFRERAAALYRRLPMLAPSGEDVQRFHAGAALDSGEASSRLPAAAAAGAACG